MAQLVKTTRVLGSITKADTDSMSDAGSMAAGSDCLLSSFSFPPCERKSSSRLPNGKAVQGSFGDLYEGLLDGLLQWRPSSRLTGQQIRAHPFFNELQTSPGTGEVLPPQLFLYTDEELNVLLL